MTAMMMAELNEAAAVEGGGAQEGVLALVEKNHNYPVTFLTPNCNSCNLGDNLWVSPLNSLNLNYIILKQLNRYGHILSVTTFFSAT